MIRFFPVALLSLLSAGVLTFCAPAPAYAQGKGTFVPCAQLAKDATTLVNVHKLGAKVELPDLDYLRAVVMIAEAAIASGAPAQYIKQFKTACEKDQA
ncbi:hypothetical protein [Escherichia coli]|uniref:hypothetical protein n=1 Tax=Escherichia coli TaxID=562 RepID=UPI00215A701E|nr:hypothetical protein [Escherichia coli]